MSRMIRPSGTVAALPLLAMIAMTLAFGAADLVTAQAPAAKTTDAQLAVVTGDEVLVRSGPADSYYPFGRMPGGSVVKVVGEKYNWQRIATVGPAFKGLFGYVRVPKTDTSSFRLEANGRRGRTLGRVELLAPNLNTNFSPRDSWKRLRLLDANVTVEVLDTIETERDTVYKVTLPANAEGWIAKSLLRPASGAEIAKWRKTMTAKADPNAKPTGDRVLARDQPETPPAVRQPTGTMPKESTASGATLSTDPPTAAPINAPVANEAREPVEVDRPVIRSGLQERLDDLEAKYELLRDEPIETAEVVPLRELYLDLEADAGSDATIARYAAARSEQLAIWAELQERRVRINELRQRAELNSEETEAVRLALETTGQYAGVGRLVASTIYDGVRLPKLFRLQDPSTHRTVAYLRVPRDDLDLPGLLGQIIGVVGAKRYDGSLRLNIIDPRHIDLLAPKR